jgi:hypothetical protein
MTLDFLNFWIFFTNSCGCAARGSRRGDLITSLELVRVLAWARFVAIEE